MRSIIFCKACANKQQPSRQYSFWPKCETASCMAASAISGNEGARCAFGDVRKADPKDQSVIGLRPALPVAHASRQRKRHSRKAYVSFSDVHTAETKTSTSLRFQPKAKQCRGPDRGCIRGSRHLTRPNRCTQAPGRFRARFFHSFARARARALSLSLSLSLSLCLAEDLSNWSHLVGSHRPFMTLVCNNQVLNPAST